MDERDERERYAQPPPGETGHEESKGEEEAVEPAVDEVDAEGSSGEQAEQADQEAKHSHPSSDPPANY